MMGLTAAVKIERNNILSFSPQSIESSSIFRDFSLDCPTVICSQSFIFVHPCDKILTEASFRYGKLVGYLP
jgi:hypothetical protein